VDEAPTWTTKSGAARELLQLLLGTGADRQRWPEDEQVAFDRVEDALARLAALDTLEPKPSPEVFRRALGAELDVRRGRAGRYGEGVTYGPLSSAVGQDLDAVFVLGLAEGTLPVPRRDDALLPDAARALVPGELPLRSQGLHDQHRWLLAALAAAPADRRVLLHPRGDLRGGRTRLPSRWLLPTASALAGCTVYSTEFDQLGAPVVDVVPSFAAGVRSAPVPASRAERDLAAVARFTEAGGDAVAHPATAAAGRGLHAQTSRRSPQLTRWDGNLAGCDVPTPASGEVLSATRLERWASCGFRYFLGDVLQLGERDDPERVIELSRTDRGSLIHQVLERFFAQVLADGPPQPDVAWSPEARTRLRAIAEEVAGEVEGRGLTGRPLRWRLQREEVFDLLDDVLSADDRFRAANQSRPSRVEFPFGMHDADPVAIELPGGRTVLFRGQADRVDATADGRYLVLDYKTGSPTAYKDLAKDPVGAGRMLQLGLYAEVAEQLLGATSAAGYYWFLGGTCDQRLGYEWTAERRERFRGVVTAIVDGIEAGTFAATPGEFDTWRQQHEHCRYCDFDRVCVVDRGEQAETKSAAVELRVRDRLLPVSAVEQEDQP
jgi:hypothetical protein